MTTASEREISNLRIQLDRKNSEIGSLKADIKFLVDSANGDLKIAYAAFQETNEQLREARRRVAEHEVKIAELEKVRLTFAPVEIDLPVADDAAFATFKAEVEKRGRKVLWTNHDESCLVCITLAIRLFHDEKSSYTVAKTYTSYPGTPEEAQAEIVPYADKLVCRAPLPENLKRRIIPGVSDETLLLAMKDMAAWWNIEGFRKNENEDYWTRLKGAFDHHIRPDVDWNAITETLAYDNWRKAVEDTFADMAEHGRGRSDKPVKRTGYKKQNLKYSSLRRNVP